MSLYPVGRRARMGRRSPSYVPQWATWSEHATTRKVYVDATLGTAGGTVDDINDPFQTIAQGIAALRDGYPDWLLLKCGETWTDETFSTWGSSRSGLDADNPMVITSYGSGPRPVVETGVAAGLDCSSAYVLIDDIEFYAHKRDPDNAAFAGWPVADSGNQFGIALRGGYANYCTIQNCLVRFYDTGIICFKDQSTARGVEDCVIRGNVVVDSWADSVVGQHTQGFYLENMVRGLVEYNFADRCGWNPDNATYGAATIYNHGFYILDTYSSTYRRNWTSRNSSFGMKLASNYLKYTPDARQEDSVYVDNFACENPNAFSIGGHGTSYAYLRCEFTHNVATLGGSTGGTPPGTGDFAVQRHMASASGADDFLYDRNLAVGQYEPGGDEGRQFIKRGWGDSPPGVYRDVSVTNNVAYDWPIGNGGGPEWGFTDGETSSGNFTLNGGISVSGNEDNLGAGSYTDPDRTALTYSTLIGEDGTTAALYALVRAQRRSAWNGSVTAPAINSYLRAGFDMSDPS